MHISYERLHAEFERVLRARHLKPETAAACATMFADTTLAGIYSHGVNRFPRFIYQLDHGHIHPDAAPEKVLSLGAIEQWDAHQAIGNLTAVRMMDRAIELAGQHGIGLVALKNANHWMRGGTYGLQAAQKGYIGICWTNSLAVMPPWGGVEPRIGTNPLVIAVPGDPPTCVDMSCSMFSYGKLEMTRLAGKQTPVDAGFDDDGHYTRDPATVEKNRRLLPMGYWKGSGLSIVLDMMATLLSGGLSVAEVSEELDDEYRVSQIFIAIEVERLTDGATRAEKLRRITDYVLSATPMHAGEKVRLPGHNLEKTIAGHRANGIPVDDGVWQKILAL